MVTSNLKTASVWTWLPVSLVLSWACGGSDSTSAVQDEPNAQAIHQAALVVDAHADIEIPGKASRYVGADGLSRVAPDKMRAGGVDAVVMAVAVSPGPRTAEGYAAARLIADEKLAAVGALVADPSNNLVLARSAEDLEAAHRDGQGALILGFQNALIAGTDGAVLEEFYDAGARVFALTHMGHNAFADSSRPLFNGATGEYEADAEHGGLSPLGVAAIRRLNLLGALIDVSQLSKLATLQVLELSTAPVIASHSNVQRLSNVRRNLSDEEIDLMGAAGGVIHISAFKGYLFDSSDLELDQSIRSVRREAGIAEDYDYPYELYWEIEDPKIQETFLISVSALLGPGRVEDMLDHVDYIVERIGVEHVGIGNDFNHGSGIEGYADASEALNVTVGLLERGYSADEIEKIWGGNFLRVWRAAAAAADAE